MEKTEQKIYYIFLGYGGENSLMPLAQYLQAKNEQVLVLDDQKFPFQRDEMLERLSEIREENRIVLINSSHVWFDRFTYHHFDRVNDPQMFSPLEMIGYLKPELSIYYPHDMGQFFHDSEYAFLDIFDIVMVPYRSNQYYRLRQAGIRSEVVGWIKKQKETQPIIQKENEPCRPVFFPSYVPDFYRKMGTEGYVKWFHDYIPECVPIKMGAGDSGVRPILTQEGRIFLDTSVSVYDAVNSYSLIIGSGTSSVVFEAALSGIPVVSLMDGIEPDGLVLEAVGDIPGVYPMHPEDLGTFLNELDNGRIIKPGPDVLKPFDFEKVYEILKHPEQVRSQRSQQ